MGDLWLIGEAPAQGYDDRPAFSSRSGQFLADLLGLPGGVDQLQETFRCHNLLSRWPGPSGGTGTENTPTIGEIKKRGPGKGADFPMQIAKPAATKMARTVFGRSDRVIMAGGRVAQAFRVRPELGLFRWGDMYSHTLMTLKPWTYEVKIAVIPHPSGVNRQWNDPDVRHQTFRFLSAAITESRLAHVPNPVQ